MEPMGLRPGASTIVVGVIGDPIRHSLSPLIHNVAFDHLGLDWVCVAFPTPAGRAIDAVRGMSALGIAGMSVTMPHKHAVIDALDEIAPDAGLLDSVNCIVRTDGRLVGINTDGDGFVAGLLADFGANPEGMDCAVIGAGGAARSVVLALARHGANSVTVINRTRRNAEVAAALADVGRVGEPTDIPGCDLVVNATSIGMAGTGGLDAGSQPALPCVPELLRHHQLVVDLIYSPLRTEWLAAAEGIGARTANGTSMLVNQAALAFEAWTGHQAPSEVMAESVRREVARRLGSDPRVRPRGAEPEKS